MRLITIVLLLISGLAYSQNSPELVSVSMSECQENCFLESNLTSMALSNDTLSIKVGVRLNCCVNEANFHFTDGVLNLIVFNSPDENGITTVCTCDCYYEVVYTIKNITNKPHAVLINGKTFNENSNDSLWIRPENPNTKNK